MQDYKCHFKQFSESNLTVMITTNLLNLQPSGQHETPIKKAKEALAFQPRTAESQQKEVVTLETIEAKELFQQFQKIVKITLQEDTQFEEDNEVSRKLDYESPLSKAKLEFSPKNSSMKKGERICFKSKTQQKFEGIVLFDTNQSEKENSLKQEEEKSSKSKGKEEKFMTPIATEKEDRELVGWATRKKLDRSD